MNKKVIRLIFHQEFDERAEWEAEQRGLCDYILVELDNGMRYPVCFYTPSRLGVSIQMLEDGGVHGVIGGSGLIVIPKITVESMMHAVTYLAQEDCFFEGLVPESHLEESIRDMKFITRITKSYDNHM